MGLGGSKLEKRQCDFFMAFKGRASKAIFLFDVFSSVGGSESMAVWTQQPKIFYSVVISCSIYMIKFKWDRFAFPACKFAPRAPML